MTPRISEEAFEYYVLDDLLANLGYQILRGEEIFIHKIFHLLK